jgi:ABC-type transporter MlaC component
MTPAQQQEFVPLFEAFIESAYLGEIQEYAS